MRMKLFTIPVFALEAVSAEMERFVASHRVLKIHRQFVQDGGNSAWCFCIDYMEASEQPTAPKRGRVDYRELLSEEDFLLYSRLRELRKQLAGQEGVPVYAVFNNEQMATMAQQRVQTKSELLKIEGIGEGRVEKYGKVFLALLQQAGVNNTGTLETQK